MNRVLLTGNGCPGNEGTIECLKTAEEIMLFGCDAQEVFGSDEFEATWLLPHATDEHYLDDIIELCQEEEIDVILPQTTAEVEVLSRTKNRRRILTEAECHVAAAPGFAVTRANDKATLMKLAHHFGVAAPKFAAINTLAELRAYNTFPFVVKPRIGNGSRGVRIVTSLPTGDIKSFLNEKPDGMTIDIEHLYAILESGEVPELLAMEYLPGDEFSVDCFRGQKVSAAVVRKRTKTRTGIATDTITYPPDSLEAKQMAGPSLYLAKHLGLFGAFGFQYKMDRDGIPKIIDCNPRVQGTMVASLYAGLNAPWLAVQEALGNHATEIQLSDESHRYVRRWAGGPVVPSLSLEDDYT